MCRHSHIALEYRHTWLYSHAMPHTRYYHPGQGGPVASTKQWGKTLSETGRERQVHVLTVFGEPKNETKKINSFTQIVALPYGRCVDIAISHQNTDTRDCILMWCPIRGTTTRGKVDLLLARSSEAKHWVKRVENDKSTCLLSLESLKTKQRKLIRSHKLLRYHMDDV